jgi:hypothetical protein
MRTEMCDFFRGMDPYDNILEHLIDYNDQIAHMEAASYAVETLQDITINAASAGRQWTW